MDGVEEETGMAMIGSMLEWLEDAPSVIEGLEDALTVTGGFQLIPTVTAGLETIPKLVTTRVSARITTVYSELNRNL